MTVKKPALVDFVRARCPALGNQSEFLEEWLSTKANPCPTCYVEKTVCLCYRKLYHREFPGR